MGIAGLASPRSNQSQRGRRTVLLLAVAATVWALAQVLQRVVVGHVPLYGTLWANKPVSIEYIQNHGAAFGLLPQAQTFFLVFAILVTVYIVVVGPRHTGTLLVQVPLGLVLGGAASNATDRITLGYVVDYVNLHWWPIFNLADAAVCVGAVGLVILLGRGNRADQAVAR